MPWPVNLNYFTLDNTLVALSCLKGLNTKVLFESVLRDRRLVLYFLMLPKSRWMFCFIFKISKSWPATETDKLLYNTINLPAKLISVPWGTTKADIWYGLSFDLSTATVDRDGPTGTMLVIQTSRSVHRRWKQSVLNHPTLCNIGRFSLKQRIIFTPKILQLKRNRSGGNLLFALCFFQHHYLTKQSSSFIRLTRTTYQKIESYSVPNNVPFNNIFTSRKWR